MLMKGEWKYVLMDIGGRCVMTDGITLTHKLFAGKWDMTQVVSLIAEVYSEFGDYRIIYHAYVMHGNHEFSEVLHYGVKIADRSAHKAMLDDVTVIHLLRVTCEMDQAFFLRFPLPQFIYCAERAGNKAKKSLLTLQVTHCVQRYTQCKM